ncbi:MAG: VanZ family protein [Actinomycetales bacterium]|nr:VanZ family protein [Actinomycetales bacterium]
MLPLGAAFSFAIEVLQLPLPDRASDPRDLVANTLGVAIGVVVGAVANAVSRGRRRGPDARTGRAPARSS